MLKSSTLGIDLAKNIFHVCEMNPQSSGARLPEASEGA
jgi:hypothetical protein